MSTELFHMRAFLNNETGAAAVEADVHDNSSVNKNTGDRYLNVGGTLHITDCSRSIQLDCCFNDLDSARNVLTKLDRLNDAVQGMRDALARAARREWPGRKF